VLRPLGFIGGPSGYQEVTEEEVGRGVIIIDEMEGKQMNWDVQESDRRIKDQRVQKQVADSSGTRNLLLLTITILMFVQVGFSVVGEIRYQAMKSKVETVIEKWTGGSGIFDTPIDPR